MCSDQIKMYGVEEIVLEENILKRNVLCFRFTADVKRQGLTIMHVA